MQMYGGVYTVLSVETAMFDRSKARSITATSTVIPRTWTFRLTNCLAGIKTSNSLPSQPRAPAGHVTKVSTSSNALQSTADSPTYASLYHLPLSLFVYYRLEEPIMDILYGAKNGVNAFGYYSTESDHRFG